MSAAPKVILAIVLGGASLVVGLMALIAFAYAFSYEMPRDQRMPTAIGGAFFGAISLGLLAAAIALIVSAIRAKR